MPVLAASICGTFIPSDLDNTISYMEVDGICIIQSGDFINKVQFDKKEFTYNPAIKENQIHYYRGSSVAVLVPEDVFYTLEEGNEDRRQVRDVIGLISAVSGGAALTPVPGAQALAVVAGASGALLVIEEILYQQDKDYKWGIYDKLAELEEEVKREQEAFENYMPPHYGYQNNGFFRTSDGNLTPVYNYYNSQPSYISNIS